MILALGASVKLAVTDLGPVMLKLHATLPLHSPPQVSKVETSSAKDVSTTGISNGMVVVQVPDVQEMPAGLVPCGLLVIVPPPVPVRVTERAGSATWMVKFWLCVFVLLVALTTPL